MIPSLPSPKTHLPQPYSCTQRHFFKIIHRGTRIITGLADSRQIKLPALRSSSMPLLPNEGDTGRESYVPQRGAAIETLFGNCRHRAERKVSFLKHVAKIECPRSHRHKRCWKNNPLQRCLCKSSLPYCRDPGWQQYLLHFSSEQCKGWYLSV